MQHVKSEHPIGTVIVPSASLTRYAEFWMSLEALQVPQGTRLIVQLGADIPHQLNEGIRGMAGEWVWILGDDHTFDHNTLLKLLDRKVDVVMPVVPRRSPPYKPVFLHGPLSREMKIYDWTDLPITGLFQLKKDDPSGQACMLVRRPVLGQIGDPWFEGGKLTPGRLMEDMYFVQRLHDLNIPIWIDCDLAVGHIANVTIIPQKYNGRWYGGYRDKGRPVLWDEPVFIEQPKQQEKKLPYNPQLVTAKDIKREPEAWVRKVDDA